MKKDNGFISIEVMLVSLICSIVVTMLMNSSFQRREEVDRSYIISTSNMSSNEVEEEVLKFILKENILNKENMKDFDFNLNNINVTYNTEKDALHIKNKNIKTGVFKHTYYDIRLNENEEIILSKRRYYEFTN